MTFRSLSSLHWTYLFDLPLHIVDEAAALAPVVERAALGGLVLAEERGRLHARVGELEVLVQVVQACEE